MSWALRIAQGLRSMSGVEDEARALEVVARAEAEQGRRLRAPLDRAAREMRGLRRSPALCLGTSLDAEGQAFPVLLGEDEVRRGGHWVVTGATGSGKSYLALGVLTQLLARNPTGIVIVDMKGELAELVRDVALPALFGSLPEALALELLGQIAVVAPFDSSSIPPFQLLARDRSLPIEVQAHEVASSFGRTVGRDLGVLQSTMLKYALLLAMDVGLSFPEVPQLLQDRDLLRGAVEKTSLPEVRTYFAERFPRERAGSVSSLLSRLDALLMHPGLRRMMGVKGMIRFDRLLERSVAILDLGHAPAGMREIGRFFGQLFFQRLVRATFARRLGPSSGSVTIMADEFQEMLSPEIAHDFERFLTLARSQRVFLWLLFQQAAQVEAVSPTLLRILRTNVNYEVMFRSSLEDARVMSHLLPVTGLQGRGRVGFPDPRNPEPLMTQEEERRMLLEQVPRMPDRLFWFANRRRPYPALLVKSATVPITRLKGAAKRLPPKLKGAIHQGVLAVSAGEIEATLRDRAARRDKLSGKTMSESPSAERSMKDENVDVSVERKVCATEPTENRTESVSESVSLDARSSGKKARKPRRSARGISLG